MTLEYYMKKKKKLTVIKHLYKASISGLIKRKLNIGKYRKYCTILYDR